MRAEDTHHFDNSGLHGPPISDSHGSHSANEANPLSGVGKPNLEEPPLSECITAPLERHWANMTVIEGDLVAFVRNLKDRPGGDIGVHASISVVQALLAAGVGDELRLAIAPVNVGSGRRLLDGLPTIGLEALRSLTSPSGYLLVDYAVMG